MAEDRGQKPTPKRLKDARKEGKVNKSQLLSQSAAAAGALIGCLVSLHFSWVSSKILLEYASAYGLTEPVQLLRQAGLVVFSVTVATLLLGGLMSALVQVLQIGLYFELSGLAPRAERLSIAAGLKRIGAGWRDSWMSFVNALVLLAVFSWIIGRRQDLIVRLGVMPPVLALRLVGEMVLWFLIAATLSLLALGAVEYLVRRRQFYRELSMSTADVQREYKEQEGDPLLKSCRRALHEDLSQQDVIARVRRAKVVLVERTERQ